MYIQYQFSSNQVLLRALNFLIGAVELGDTRRWISLVVPELWALTGHRRAWLPAHVQAQRRTVCADQGTVARLGPINHIFVESTSSRHRTSSGEDSPSVIW